MNEMTVRVRPAHPVEESFWEFAVHMFDLAARKGEVAFQPSKGRFDVPSWFWHQADHLAERGSRPHRSGLLFGFAARLDPLLDPDAIRYVR